MKSLRYVFRDSVLVLIVWGAMVTYTVCDIRASGRNYVLLFFAAAAAFYFVPKSLQWVFCWSDMAGGAKMREAVFWDVYGVEKLDVLYKVQYTIVLLSDGDTAKCYKAFRNVPTNGFTRGDAVRISYYPRTRIMSEMVRLNPGDHLDG